MASASELELDAADARYEVMPSVRTVELDGELVLLDIVRGEYFGLDELGTRAWAHLQAGRSVREIATSLAPGYDVGLETLTRDLRSFVEQLESAGLVGATP